MPFNEPVGFKSSSRVKASLDRLDEYPYHMHEDVIEIIFVLKGELHISDSAQDYLLSQSDIYVFNPKDPHKIIAKDPSNAFLTIQIDQSYYLRYFKGIDVFPYFICEGDMRYLRFLISKIYVEYIKRKPSDSGLEELTVELLNHMMDYHRYYAFLKGDSDKLKMVRSPEANKSDEETMRIYRIIDYIYANYNNKISLKELSELEFLSPEHLSRYIKDMSGLTFSEQVSLARCEEVERLLGKTNKTIDEIAIEVGFANRNHLARQFKKWFQKTPSEYRKNIYDDLAKMTEIEYKDIQYEEVQDIINKYLDGK